jgi:hypothetical protein
LETLAKVDPAIAVLFKQHVERASADCIDRPADSKKRSVTMQFDFTPVCDQQGELSGVRMQVLAKTSIPNFVTNLHEMTATKRGVKFVPKHTDIGNLQEDESDK